MRAPSAAVILGDLIRGFAGMHRALILIVDSKVESRHWLWRHLGNHGFGVLEAPNADCALRWIDERPDIDAMIIDDELVDGRGAEIARELSQEQHPIAERAVVIASEWRRVMLSGLHVVERGDIESLMSTLSKWFAPSAPRRAAQPQAMDAR